jgi:hypothetical protein
MTQAHLRLSLNLALVYAAFQENKFIKKDKSNQDANAHPRLRACARNQQLFFSHAFNPGKSFVLPLIAGGFDLQRHQDVNRV